MSTNHEDHDLPTQLVQRLSHHGIRATPQALNSLISSLTQSSPEIAGDSDSLLLGLLQSGSYTVELLRDAGADTDYLTKLVTNSAARYESPRSADELDAVSSLFSYGSVFSRVLERPELKTRPLETADLLQHAISPSGGITDQFDDHKRDLALLMSGRRRRAPSQRLMGDLERTVAEVLLRFGRYLWEHPAETLLSEREPLVRSETQRLAELYRFEAHDSTTIEKALNYFIQTKTLPIDDEEFLRVALATSQATIGFSQFLNGGGRFKDLSLALDVTARFAPERDEPLLGLLEHHGRIVARHFTYRGTGLVPTTRRDTMLSISSGIVVPLIPESVLRELEAIVNRPQCKELDLQRFLEANPEILKSLGYSACRSQVVLREPGRPDLIPDFLLQRPGNVGFDILDLKLPSAALARQKPYARVSGDITRAVAQLHAYRNFFQKPANRDTFIREHGIEYLEPQLIVAIGRQDQYRNLEHRATIEGQTKDVRVLTYDDLIAYAKTRVLPFR
jgi:hypothetical protein